MSKREVQEEKDAESLMTALAASVSMHQLENTSSGNCLFESFALLIYGSSSLHRQVREEAVEYIRNNSDTFMDAVVAIENDDHAAPARAQFNRYLSNTSRDTHWGDAVCIEALAMRHKLRVSVYVSPAGYRVELNSEGAETRRHVHIASISNRHFRAMVPDRIDNFEQIPLSVYPPLPFARLSSMQDMLNNLTYEHLCSFVGRNGI